MRAIAIITRRDSGERVTCALIEAHSLNDLATRARHLGYQHNADYVDLYKLDRRANRRKYIHFVRQFDADAGRSKLVSKIVVNHVYAHELPNVPMAWTEETS